MTAAEKGCWERGSLETDDGEVHLNPYAVADGKRRVTDAND